MRRPPLRRSSLAAAVGAAALLAVAAGCGSSAGGSAKPTTTPTPTPSSSAPAPSSSSAAPVNSTSNVTTAIPLPSGNVDGFGEQTSIAMGGAEAPVVAWVWQNPGGNDKPNSDELFTSTYDPQGKAWGAPVKQATGDFEGRFGTDMQLAGDPTTGTVALVWSTGTSAGTTGIALALSTDGGATWTQSTVTKTDNASRPAVAVGGGKVYVGYPVGDGELHLATSDGLTSPTFTDVTLPGDGDNFTTANEQPAVAAAPDGTPLVAYETNTGDNYDRELLSWTPGDTKAVKVLDSEGYQNDSGTVGLAFQGSTALVIDSVLRADSDDEKTIGYLASSTDDGKTWTPDEGTAVPTLQPVDGPFSFALAAGKAETVLAYYPNGGGGRTCAGVVLAGTTDLKSWKSCDPFQARWSDVSEQFYPAATVDTDGSVLVVFANTNTDHPTEPTGILVWTDGGQAVAGLGG